MNLSMQPYKGARDFYPDDFRVRRALFDVWRKVAYSFGYEEYDAPILEPLELFAAKSGDELVNEQSYAFQDRGGRMVALRPEMTPSVSRLIAGKRQELPTPIRWFSIPSCWRYERPQKGRGREFYQFNADIFGVDDGGAEVELLQMVDAIMSAFKARKAMYEIRLNNRKLMDYILSEWLGLDGVEQKTIARLIDRMQKMDTAEFKGLVEAAISPSLRERGAADKLFSVLDADSLEELPADLQNQPSITELKQLMTVCESLGITNIRFDIKLMRGLDYYTGIVFEVFDTDPDNNRSLFGGGRYDGLVSYFGVEPIPMAGFAMSDVMLLEFLRGHGLVPEARQETEVIVLPIGDVYQEAVKITAQLRSMGVNTALDLTGRKTDKQLKAANKRGVPYVLFVGEQELASEQYKLKDLESGSEETRALERLVTIIKDRRKAPESSTAELQ